MVHYFIFLVSSYVEKSNISLDNKLSIWAIVISVIAIIVSIGTSIWQGFQERKRQDIDLKSIYYKDIYWEYLIKKLPAARELVGHNKSENRIVGTNTIIEELNNIRRDSLFFKFIDREFYDNICEKFQDLEDKYVSEDKMTQRKYEEFDKKVDEMLSEIYDMITLKYIGHKN